MMSILRNPKYTLNVTFLEGSALNDHDLRRAHVTTATAIFIMTDKFTADPDQEDARAILQQFSIKRFIAANATQLETRPEFRMQLIRVENLRHLDTEQDDDTSANDVVVCLNEIKMVLPLPLPLPLPLSPDVELDNHPST
jgi:potassium large conductance calcium-activated channel subfamily M alpha member 1